MRLVSPELGQEWITSSSAEEREYVNAKASALASLFLAAYDAQESAARDSFHMQVHIRKCQIRQATTRDRFFLTEDNSLFS